MFKGYLFLRAKIPMTFKGWFIPIQFYIFKKWDISERSVRNYCAQNRVDGAFIAGKTWKIPENAKKPVRTNKKKEQPVTLLDILKEQKINKYSGGIYHKTQIDLMSIPRTQSHTVQHWEPPVPSCRATQSINQSHLYTFSCKMYL